MKLLKILLYVVGGLVLLVVVAGVAATLFLDPNQFKPQIVKAVKEQTGRDLDIQGDLKLSVFPWLGLQIGPTRLSNREGFGEQPFAQVDQVDVRVKLMPLIERRVEADTVALSGLQLALMRNAQGEGNWEDLTAAGPQTPTPEEAPQTGEGLALAGLVIDGVDVADAQVSWDDRQAGQRVAIRDFDLKTGAVDLNQPLPIEASFELETDAPQLRGQVSIDGTIAMDMTQQQYGFGDGMIEFSLSGAAVPGGEATGKLGVNLTADLAKQVFGVGDGTFAFTLKGADLPGGQVEGELGFEASADLAAQTAKLSRLDGTVMGLAIKAVLDVTQLDSEPQAKGTLNLAEFSPRDLMKTLDLPVPETADPKVLSRVSLQTGLVATPARAALNGLKAVLDDTTLSGQASVSNFSQPAVRFDLNVDAIDLDRYMAPPAEGTDQAAEGDPPAKGDPPVPGAAPASGGAVGLPLETLRGLDVVGKARVDTLKVSNLTARDAQVRLEAKGGMLQLNPISVNLYEGTAKGRMAMDVRADQPVVSSKLNVVNVQAEPLLNDLQGKAMLAGRGLISLDVKARGLTPNNLKRSLNGNVGIKFKDGAVNGINVAQIIREGQARLSGQTIQKTSEPNRTDFAELSGTAQITNGLVSNQDLALKSPLLRVLGAGEASLPAETMDYLVKASVVGSLKGQGGQDLGELQGVTIPVRIGGTFSEPTFRPDLEAALSEAAKARVDAEIDKQKEKLQEKAGEEIQKQLGDKLEGDLGNQLKGLFK